MNFFYVQLHLGFGGAHHPDLAGAGALVRVLPGEFNLRSEKNKKFLSSIAFSSIQSYVTRHLHLSLDLDIEQTQTANYYYPRESNKSF